MADVVLPEAPFDKIRMVLDFIARLKEKFPKLTLADLFAIAEAASKLQDLPDLQDEAACRQWCRMAIGVLEQVAQLTTVTIDDQTVAMFRNVVESDDLWGLTWRIVEWIVPDEDRLPGSIPLAADEFSARLGIDWAKLAVLIQAIIDFIKTWKS